MSGDDKKLFASHTFLYNSMISSWYLTNINNNHRLVINTKYSSVLCSCSLVQFLYVMLVNQTLNKKLNICTTYSIFFKKWSISDRLINPLVYYFTNTLYTVQNCREIYDCISRNETHTILFCLFAINFNFPKY